MRSLTIYGDVLMQPAPLGGNIRLDAAFILVKGTAARFAINNTAWSRQVTIFLRRNPAAYDDLPPAPSDEDKMLGGGRALAAWQGAQVRQGCCLQLCHDMGRLAVALQVLACSMAVAARAW